MRARLTSWSAIGVSSPLGKLMCVAAAMCAVAAIGYGGIARHRAGIAEGVERAQREWRDSDTMRKASRYGDVKVPLRGDNLCTAYAFDNWRGSFVDERVTECEPPRAPSSVAKESSGDTVSRLNGVAAAFKRQ